MSGNAPQAGTTEPVTLTQADIDKARAEGYAAGATAERERILSVEAQALPGHEALIAGFKADGKTSGPEAAVAILAAEKAATAGRLEQIRGEAPAPAPAAHRGDDTQSGAGKLTTEQKAQADWDKNPKLSGEFGTFATYLAYATAQAAGQVKVLSAKQ